MRYCSGRTAKPDNAGAVTPTPSRPATGCRCTPYAKASCLKLRQLRQRRVVRGNRRRRIAACFLCGPRGYKPDGTLFRYLIRESGLSVSQILHSGQSQFTDMVGGKPLSLSIAWINRRDLDLSPDVPAPDFIFSGLEPLPDLLT